MLLSVRALALCFAFGSVACGVVYPEMATPFRTPPPGFRLDPPPPRDLYYLRFDGAVIPARTVDGRSWDAIGGAAPDPYAKLLMNGLEVIVTPVDSDTLRPRWPDQVRANYRIPSGAALRVEVWDKNPITSHPICTEEIRNLADEVSSEHPLEITCESGARVRLVVEPAHGKLGLGFYYELHTEAAFVTKVLAESPARRVGLAVGDEILTVQGHPVGTMEEGKLKSLINANGGAGVRLTVKKANGQKRDLVVRDAAIYPVFGEPVAVD